MFALQDWFAARKASKQHTKALDPKGMDKLPDEHLKHLWTQCVSCGANYPTKKLKDHLSVCPECGYHFRISALERIAQLCDHFQRQHETLAPNDPLQFHDLEPYAKRQVSAHKKTGLHDAIVAGIAHTEGYRYALAVMDFAYMGGSMGSVVGEVITRMAETALTEGIPFVMICASGGARMQEGTLSLMQMVKTGAALSRLHEAGILYITLLTEPTYGGVTASYGMLGDIILAEKGSRIGFAGRRVIEQTIRQKLPNDFQTAEYLLDHGQLDQVLERPAIRSTLVQLFKLHGYPLSDTMPSVISEEVFEAPHVQV
ncbi:MAG: acetyl-CoA carboxylase, carboxyltransferase subunit beta [Vampirovibrionales bacterium]